ncbi:MAG: hypothetical protein ACRDXD_04105 [Acidimicrobiia bacterium]
MLPAIGALVAIWRVETDHYLRKAMWVFIGLLVLLFVFAGIVDLFSDAYPNEPLRTIEELDEQISLALIIAYTTGLAISTKGLQ